MGGVKGDFKAGERGGEDEGFVWGEGAGGAEGEVELGGVEGVEFGNVVVVGDGGFGARGAGVGEGEVTVFAIIVVVVAVVMVVPAAALVAGAVGEVAHGVVVGGGEGGAAFGRAEGVVAHIPHGCEDGEGCGDGREVILG